MKWGLYHTRIWNEWEVSRNHAAFSFLADCKFKVWKDSSSEWPQPAAMARYSNGIWVDLPFAPLIRSRPSLSLRLVFASAVLVDTIEPPTTNPNRLRYLGFPLKTATHYERDIRSPDAEIKPQRAQLGWASSRAASTWHQQSMTPILWHLLLVLSISV